MAATRLSEFQRIERFFRPLAAPGALDLIDDVALIDGPPGQQLVLTVDAIVSGVDYFPEDPPDLVARKLMRVNLSDLAAKGARPMGYLLVTVLPAACDEDWLAGFSAGLAQDQVEFGIALLGGDSSGTPGPATLSLTAIGTVAAGKAVLRRGARPGDDIYVSGTIGDSALGLRCLQGRVAGLDAGECEFLADRYRLPRPRLALGQALVGIAHAMIDVSDGLVADLGHICEASGVAAVIEAARVPLSGAARRALQGDPALIAAVLAGGDDYELACAIAPERAADAAEAARAAGVTLTWIGRVEQGSGVHVLDDSQQEMVLAATGYRHF